MKQSLLKAREGRSVQDFWLHHDPPRIVNLGGKDIPIDNSVVTKITDLMLLEQIPFKAGAEYRITIERKSDYGKCDKCGRQYGEALVGYTCSGNEGCDGTIREVWE